MTSDQSVQKLRGVLNKMQTDSTSPFFKEATGIQAVRDEVISRYGPMFSPDNLGKLTAEDFCGFLLFRNNKHWNSLHRQGGLMTANMKRLREAIKLVVDENQPIRKRLDRVRPSKGDPMVKGFSRAVITAILHVVYPNKYGVVNNIAEAGMRRCELWPDLPKGTSFGGRYEAINGVLLETAKALGIDLWTLDILWWYVESTEQPPAGESGGDKPTGPESAGPGLPGVLAPEPKSAFGLERHLHEFLVDNWAATELSKEWVLLEEDGEITGAGSEFDTGEVGVIDLLAKHLRENRWLVVELKRDQGSDQTIGQLLRYMGWVRRNRAEGGQVEGLIICQEVDRKLQYAMDSQANIRCMTYQVSFALQPAPGL